MSTEMKFIEGRVEIPLDSSDDLLEALKSNRELLTKAVDIMLKSKGYTSSRIIHDASGKVFADVTGNGKLPEFKSMRKPIKKEMSKGWTRKFVGFTRELRDILNDYRKRGRKEIDFDSLYNATMEVFKDVQKTKYKAMEKSRFAMYLHDKRLFPNIKYNGVRKMIEFK